MSMQSNYNRLQIDKALGFRKSDNKNNNNNNNNLICIAPACRMTSEALS